MKRYFLVVHVTEFGDIKIDRFHIYTEALEFMWKTDEKSIIVQSDTDMEVVNIKS